MHEFFVKEISTENVYSELLDIGFDKSYINNACEKFEYKNYKIYDLTPAQANIIKQTALSVGADCATHKEVITGKIEKSSCLLGGSISQLKKISEKLEVQPFGLKVLGKFIVEKLDNKPCNKTKLMGILNLTKDSFSDGGDFYELEDSIAHIHKLIKEGADIIDIGAESTRPGAFEVSAEKQLEKLIPVLKYIKENNINIPISIDTRSSIVANECVKYGVSIINDVSGLDFDKNMINTIKESELKIVIQHSSATPDIMQSNTVYDNLIDEIYKKLSSKVNFALSNGIKKENIIIDPGIGFGKSRADNIELIKRLHEFKTIGCPILIGVSRKSFLNIQNASNNEKDLYTLAINSILINQNVDMIRVHNVGIHKKFMQIYEL